ncbi:hemerythrin domain-containing protein [Actinoallomurus iriomotensis]|nr:hemerythrin domain-containing protein [Actinoallomurus iriomotensis]
MPNVFDVLREDHQEVLRALAELESGPPATSASAEQPAAREKLVEHLIIEESKHEAVEEEFFWPAVRDRVPDGDRLADHAVEQEQAAKHVLNDLIGLKADDPKFDELVRGFIADGREHIAYEETSVWPELRKALSAEEADDLGTRLQQGKKAAPTRPHPHTPPKPGLLKTAGPAIAAADRVRDAVTRRGKG